MTMRKQRLVIKAGSSSLTSRHGGCDPVKMERIVSAIARLRANGHEVVFVSSGAVASGFKHLGYQQRPRTTAAKQAAAAIGQSLLMQTYTSLFAAHHLTIAQILLTRGDFSDRERYDHAFQTLSLLLTRQILPIINENDTVSVAELTFGDNDMLGALVAGLVHADRYIMLTDMDGLYEQDPRKQPDARRIPYLPAITPELEALAGKPSALGTGGMRSKLLAAKTALGLGIPSYIGKLGEADQLLHVLAGTATGTYIGAPPGHMTSRHPLPKQKQWIALHSPVKGRLYVDEGAAIALLEQRKSLLAPGVRQFDGDFANGDVVEVYLKEQLLGRGVARLDAGRLRMALQAQKQPMRGATVIHRDYWIAVDRESPGLLSGIREG